MNHNLDRNSLMRITIQKIRCLKGMNRVRFIPINPRKNLNFKPK